MTTLLFGLTGSASIEKMSSHKNIPYFNFLMLMLPILHSVFIVWKNFLVNFWDKYQLNYQNRASTLEDIESLLVLKRSDGYESRAYHIFTGTLPYMMFQGC